MFDNLSDKLQRAFKNLRGQGVITQENIGEALQEIRLAMLEADVNFKVVKQLIDQIREIVEAEGIDKIVIGLPKNMDGTLGPSAAKARSFGERLAQAIPNIKILLWDERLSTMAVEREMIAHDVTRAKRDKVVDQAAAAFILQGALDALARTKASGD